jgi:hypothetical protein
MAGQAVINLGRWPPDGIGPWILLGERAVFGIWYGRSVILIPALSVLLLFITFYQDAISLSYT